MAHITMRINKSGQRVFRIRVEVNGTEFQRTYPEKGEPPIPASWSDKRARTEATKAAAFFEDECRRGLVTNDKRTLSEYAQYVLNLKANTGAIKPSTIAGYRRLLSRIESAAIGRVRVRDITVKDLNGFYQELSCAGSNLQTGGVLSSKTIREHHSFLSSVLHQAAREGLIAHNPAQNATLPKIEHKEANFYSPERMSAIVAAIQHEPVFWQAITYLFIGTGARRGEILGLQWSDVDFEGCRLWIRRNVILAANQVHIGSTKTGRDRVVSIASDFLKPLQEWKSEQERIFGFVSISGFCFALEDPNRTIRPDSVTRYYRRFGVQYNLGHINPHAFRHSQASILLQDGDIVTASKRLGHAQTSTTMNIYGHMMPATDRAAADRVGAAFLNIAHDQE